MAPSGLQVAAVQKWAKCEIGASAPAVFLCSSRWSEVGEQERQIVRPIERPKRPQNGVRVLTWPALADIAAKFPLDISSAYWLPRETGHAVDQASDASSIIECRGKARRRHIDGERGKGWVFLHGDLAHERQNARIVELVRRVAVVVESTVEHGARHDVGQTVIRRLLGIRRPFLLITPCYLVTTASRADLDRGTLPNASIILTRDRGV